MSYYERQVRYLMVALVAIGAAIGSALGAVVVWLVRR